MPIASLVSRSLSAALAGGVLSLLSAGSAVAYPDSKSPAPEKTAKAAAKTPVEVKEVNLLTGLRNGTLAVEAEGSGDGRMTLSITNRTRKQLRVILPPGLVAAGATGQFGGGGMGGGMGGMGGGMGGMGGGGMMGGMGGGMGGMGGGMGGMGGGMGGMGGGGMGGGMGGGGMGGGMGGGAMTMPPMMGMMMLGRLIMQLCGDPDSWDTQSMMSGMMGGMGGGMGGMGGMGGGMGGMGGMGGGMGGGMRSVPPTGLPSTTLRPGQTRSLPTPLVSLGTPGDASRISLPPKGEKLQIGDVTELSDDPRLQTALRRLTAEKAPAVVAQLVLLNLGLRDGDGLNWTQIAQLSKGWANASEIALAKQFVSRLDRVVDEARDPKAGFYASDSGTLYVELPAEAAALGKALDGKVMLGLNVRLGVPAQPEGPAVSCKVKLVGAGAKAEAVVLVSTTDETGDAWEAKGKFVLPAEASGRIKAEEMVDAMAEGILNRLVRAQLSKGRKINGKETFSVRIDNSSPLVLNGLALAGSVRDEAKQPTALAGFSLSPRKSLTFPATSELVERLGLKKGVRVYAADLSGL